MNGKVALLFIIYLFFYNVIVCYSEVWDLGPGDNEIEDQNEHKYNFGNVKLNSSYYQKVKRYYCTVDSNFKNSYQILFGANAWRFPVQDVNLTLSYPMNNGGQDYILTAMEVMLYSDGARSRGYIISGGMLQDHISMVYILPNITRLAYQFWLRGVPKNHFDGALPIPRNNLCTASTAT